MATSIIVSDDTFKTNVIISNKNVMALKQKVCFRKRVNVSGGVEMGALWALVSWYEIWRKSVLVDCVDYFTSSNNDLPA